MSSSEYEQAEEAFGATLIAYAGRWVAVTDRAVVESANTLDELLECVQGRESQVEIFRVPKHPEAASFF